ncbi:hypothetical protein QFZ21_001626 [Microbacterium sp. W4I20]|nr:hypothetical protein [Microbacterium sp. W4I20]
MVGSVPGRGRGEMSSPVFMSAEHIAVMHRRLDASVSVALACRDLDRAYALSFVLTHGPDGEDVRWQMTFDPHRGVRIDVGDPSHADVTFAGEWAEVHDALHARGRGEDVTMPLRPEGDLDVLERIAPVHATVQRIGSVETTLPEPRTTRIT